MNTLRQAAQAAEDFLDRRWRKTGACDDDIREHAEALRASLAEPQPVHECADNDSPWLVCKPCAAEGKCKQAEPQPEPVAWAPNLNYPDYEKQRVWANGAPKQTDIDYWAKYDGITLAYAAPQAQAELSSSEPGNVKQPLKERPDFIAGYTADLADGKACAERDAEPFNAKADRLRIAGVTLIGLAEHDQRCDVFGLDDDGRHMACSCGLDESVKIIAEAAHWTRGE